MGPCRGGLCWCLWAMARPWRTPGRRVRPPINQCQRHMLRLEFWGRLEGPVERLAEGVVWAPGLEGEKGGREQGNAKGVYIAYNSIITTLLSYHSSNSTYSVSGYLSAYCLPSTMATTDKKTDVDYLVIGAGSTGLGTAKRLQQLPVVFAHHHSPIYGCERLKRVQNQVSCVIIGSNEISLKVIGKG